MTEINIGLCFWRMSDWFRYETDSYELIPSACLCICLMDCWIICILQGPLPLDPQLLGERAMHCRAYAKALHYKEDEFHKGPNSQVFEALISINNKLQQKEAAAGKP